MESFEEWVEAGGPRLVRFAYLVVGDRTLAEDLAQDVLADAYARWSKVSRADHLDAYLRRAVLNRRASWWRRSGRREVPVATAYGDTAAAHGADDGPESALWLACAALPERQRAAIVLRFYEHLSHAEIADALGCREATARSLVHRGLTQLRATHTLEELL